MTAKLTAMYEKGAITADHLVVESLAAVDPSNPGSVLQSLSTDLLQRTLKYAREHQPGKMRTNYGRSPTVEQVQAAKQWIELLGDEGGGVAIRRSFGWDLAAYGKSYSALCYGVRDGNSFTATILKCKAICCPQLNLTSDLRSVVADERKMLELCCAFAEFIVDVPIDLRPLLDVTNRHSCDEANYYWQLVSRPVDQALGGLKPLADRIGYPVARLANLLRTFKDGSSVGLNKTLFETYPAASLELIRRTNEKVQRVYDKYRWIYGLKQKEPKNWPSWLRDALKSRFGEELKLIKDERSKLVKAVLDALAAPNNTDFSEEVKRGFKDEKIERTEKPPYKGGAARFHQSGWVAKGKDWSDQCLAELMDMLGFRASAGDENFDADEFDSVMCSVVGCFPECTMPEADLRQAVRDSLNADGSVEGIPDDVLVATGYRVLNTWPENMSVLLKSQEFKEASVLHDYLRGLHGAASFSK